MGRQYFTDVAAHYIRVALKYPNARPTNCRPEMYQVAREVIAGLPEDERRLLETADRDPKAYRLKAMVNQEFAKQAGLI